MKKHTKAYFAFFNYKPGDFISCELPGCGQEAVDIHHIKARGMGGTKEPEKIENLMALCRKHHDQYGDKKQHVSMLIEAHRKHIYDQS